MITNNPRSRSWVICYHFEGIYSLQKKRTYKAAAKQITPRMIIRMALSRFEPVNLIMFLSREYLVFSRKSLLVFIGLSS